MNKYTKPGTKIVDATVELSFANGFNTQGDGLGQGKGNGEWESEAENSDEGFGW